jgi:hypothetical protein
MAFLGCYWAVIFIVTLFLYATGSRLTSFRWMTFRFYWILVLFLSVVATLMLFLVWLIFPSLSA